MLKVKTLPEYIKTVTEICKKWPHLQRGTTHSWFRGQSDETWSIIPGIYRGHTKPDYERELVRDFRLRSTAYLSSLPSHDLELLFVMQHHGMPTRLLDWTESYMVALYFAVKEMENTNDAAVWILDPWSLNIFTLNFRSVPTIDLSELQTYVLKDSPQQIHRVVEAQWPVAIRPCHGTSRIVAQRGMFTLHGHEQSGIEAIKQIGLEKIIIDGSQKRSILKELYVAGVTHATVFPDLDGLAREISFRYSKKYMS
ncbi:MAG: FRG domain-containing protein [Desulfuromonadaceae bacterium]|jgi:hypothetical protein